MLWLYIQVHVQCVSRFGRQVFKYCSLVLYAQNFSQSKPAVLHSTLWNVVGFCLPVILHMLVCHTVRGDAVDATVRPCLVAVIVWRLRQSRSLPVWPMSWVTMTTSLHPCLLSSRYLIIRRLRTPTVTNSHPPPPTHTSPLIGT